MTLPRRIIPNTTYLVTRRCTQRQFLLKPTKRNTNIFIYCLALAAKKSGVLIHAVCVLSNHYHAVVTDTKGNLPQFMEYLHKYVAKTINASLGRWENFWASEKPSAVVLKNPQDVLDKIAYTVCNPVEAGLVAKTIHWPGLTAFSPGRILCAKRPDVFFRAEGPMPPSASLAIAMPPQFDQFSQGQYKEVVCGEMHKRERALVEAFEKAGRSFMGVSAVMRQKHWEQPKTTEPRRHLNPRIACQSKWHRIEALARLKSFIVEYRDALRRWRDGERGVIFPRGTYYLRIHAGVCCAPG